MRTSRMWWSSRRRTGSEPECCVQRWDNFPALFFGMDIKDGISACLTVGVETVYTLSTYRDSGTTAVGAISQRKLS